MQLDNIENKEQSSWIEEHIKMEHNILTVPNKHLKEDEQQGSLFSGYKITVAMV